MAEAIVPILAITPEDAMKSALGAVGGTISAVSVIIPKTVLDLFISAFGDDRPVSLAKALVDGGFGAWCLYDIATRKDIDPFWKGAESAFGLWEILYSAITFTTTAMRYISP
jgi:hypothetical protein